MPTHPDPANDLTDLERRLASWQPSSTGLDSDRTLYAAGRASARPRLRLWAGLAGLMTVLALLLTGLLITASHERHSLVQQLTELQDQLSRLEKGVEGGGSEPAPSPEPPARSDYLTLRNLVLKDGVDAWQSDTRGARPAPDHPPDVPIWHVGQRCDLIEY